MRKSITYKVRIRPGGEVILGLPLALLEAAATPLIGADGMVQVVPPPGRFPAALESMSRFGGRTPETPARLLTVEEFARAVGISRATVYALIKEGLPAPKIPQVGRRIDLEQARSWMVARGHRENQRNRKGKRRA